VLAFCTRSWQRGAETRLPTTSTTASLVRITRVLQRFGIPHVPGEPGIAELSALQFDEDMAFEDAVVEHHICEAINIINNYQLLARLETAAVAELE
jgi:hypothetical protein